MLRLCEIHCAKSSVRNHRFSRPANSGIMSSPKKNRSPARLLSKVFLQSESPFYLVDPRGQIAFVNSALSSLVQVATDELLGQPCLSPIPDSKLTHGKILAWLSIPPEVLFEENDPSQPKPSIVIRSLASPLLPTASSAETPKTSSSAKEINTSVCIRIRTRIVCG